MSETKRARLARERRPLTAKPADEAVADQTLVNLAKVTPFEIEEEP